MFSLINNCNHDVFVVRSKLRHHCVFAQREECLALSLTSSLEPSPVLGATTADGTGLLHTAVERGILEASVVLTERTLLGLVDHSEHTSNVLAHHLGLGLLSQLVALHLRHDCC